MRGYEVYTFLICLFIGILLATVLTLLLVNLYKTTRKLIVLGGQDQEIIKDKKKELKLKKGSATRTLVIESIISGVLAALCFGAFIAALVSSPMDINSPVKGEVAQVVKSSSMSYKNEENTYLEENNLNNQFDTFDLVIISTLPAEEDLKLYDIVVYESNGVLVIHRIVEIEEPNQYHPDCRYFRTQGDAIDSHDKFPVLYSQMRGIYTGKRVPFIGSFILFLQSYPGYLCIGLIIASCICIPIFENRLDKLKDERFKYLLENDLVPEDEEPEKSEENLDKIE